MAGEGKSNPVSYQQSRRATAAQRGRGRSWLQRIVSGGQTGVDRAALDCAIAHGIPHGGWCPHGRWAEDGAIERHYALNETPDSHCAQRTEWNVRDSDGTVIFTISPELSGGSALTYKLARRHGKPCLHLARELDRSDVPAKLRAFILRERIQVLNIAGPRLSSEPEAARFASEVLHALLERRPAPPATRPGSRLRPTSRPNRLKPALQSTALSANEPSRA
ncbi:MAG TPA: putative molybdenum carrier protein [Verrucomicrobiae bacterium]